MPNGLLYRVAVDSESGGWNAPCRKNGSFCYVSIPDDTPSGRGSMFDHGYDEFIPFVTAIGDSWPAGLSGLCHLDPDFAHLTYGDAGGRAQRIREFIVPGSFIVFWAGLRWLDGPQAGSIVCSIIGFYQVSHVLCASDIGILDTHRNAHTRHATLPTITLLSLPTLATPGVSAATFLSASTATERSAYLRTSSPLGVISAARTASYSKTAISSSAVARLSSTTPNAS
jgi:hypothetical protein